MRTRLFKKELFSKATLFFFVTFFLPLSFIVTALHCQAAERETTPLLGAINSDLESGSRNLRESPADALVLPPAIEVQPFLLQPVNRTLPVDVPVNGASLVGVDPQRLLAQDAMNKIINCLGYIAKPEFQQGIEEQARRDGVIIQDRGVFRQSLLDTGYANATGGELTEYLKAVRRKIIDLQKTVPLLQIQIAELKQHIDSLLILIQGDGDKVEGLQQTVRLLQAQNQELRRVFEAFCSRIEQQRKFETGEDSPSAKEIARLKKANFRTAMICWIAIPVASLVVGGISVGVTYLLMK